MTLPSVPYHNLILTGHIGVGRITVGRAIARLLSVQFIDLDTELQLREGMAPDEIRSYFGESRLRTLEDQLCGELSLRRGSVLSISGPTLLDENNRNRLLNSGPLLILTCALNEILRRLHTAQGARFHDPKVRSASLYQIRRERQIEQMTAIPTLDTTTLSVDEVAEHAIKFWREHDVLAS
jgi:shikimate kinase